MQFLLVHSPVVGPSSWRWIADALRTAGHDVSLPDLGAAARSGDPLAFARAAADAAPLDKIEPIVIVGHSGAGAVLPLIAASARISISSITRPRSPASSSASPNNRLHLTRREVVRSMP